MQLKVIKDCESSVPEQAPLLQVMTLIQDIPVPVIAMVNGVATAAGCQLVASCDIAVATEKSTFATPGVNVGLFCSTPAVAIGRAVPRKVRARSRRARTHARAQTRIHR